MICLKDLATGKVSKAEGMGLVKAGTHEVITPAEYHRIRNEETGVNRIGDMTRPIYARVSTPTFDSFRRRVKAEGVHMDEALAGLVTAYAKGMVLSYPKAKKTQTGADYIGANHGQKD